MSKLEGVKTLDMVNGEITKVSYGGVEYERTEGIPRSVGKSGDLVLNGHRHPDLKLGEFYRLVWDEDNSRVSVLDEVGDLHGNAVTDRDSVLFRKVSAPQPTLEDRVSTNEKDIESLKSDVAALKGEAKTEYVRIDKSEAKAGDFIKYIVTASPSVVKNERLYEINGLRSGRHFTHINEDGDMVRTMPNEVFEVYRKVSAAEPKPERLKVGDYARVVTDRTSHAKRDDVVKIIDDDKSVVPFLAVHLNGGNAGWFNESQLVRATDEEVAEAKDAAARAKFKKGDKVRLKSGGGEYPLLGFENGKVCTVIHNDYYHGDAEKKIQIECGCYYGYATPDQLELLSEEEAAEIEKWVEIGREVGEYKEGDVVAYDDRNWFENSGIGEIVGFGDKGNPEVEAIDYGGHRTSYFLKPELLNLVTPVELRFDRKGDE